MIRLKYYAMSSSLMDKLGMTDNEFTIDLPHSFNVQIKKGVMNMTLPTEGGITAEDIQAGGSLIMAMGGTSRTITIRFTIAADTHDDFVKEFNKLYAFFSVLSIGDTLGLTVDELILSDTTDELNYSMWREVYCIFQGANFSYTDKSPNSAEVSITLLIGEVM